MDQEALDACRRNAALQVNLSGERIRAELLKLLGAPEAARVVRSMAGVGILAPLFPAEPNTDALDRLIILETEADSGRADALRRLAILLGPGDDAIIDRLRLSNAERARFLAMSTDRLDPKASESVLKAWLYKLGPTRFTDAILFTAAAEQVEARAVAAALELARTWTVPRFPLRGADLIKLGLAPGQPVGRILAGIEGRWIADGMRGDQEICLSWARQAIEQDRNQS